MSKTKKVHWTKTKEGKAKLKAAVEARRAGKNPSPSGSNAAGMTASQMAGLSQEAIAEKAKRAVVEEAERTERQLHNIPERKVRNIEINIHNFQMVIRFAEPREY